MVTGVQGIIRGIEGISRLQHTIKPSADADDADDAVKAPLTPVQQGEQARQRDKQSIAQTSGPSIVDHQSPSPAPLDGEVSGQGDPDIGVSILPMGLSPLLGRGATRYINQSPTLTGQLKTLEEQGWTVRYAKEGESTGVNSVDKVIMLNPVNNGNRDASVRELSFDVGLATYRDISVPLDTSSLRSYVYDSMTPYAKALENQYNIKNEIHDERNWAEFGDFGLSIGDERKEDLQRLLTSDETGDALYDDIIGIYRDEPAPGTGQTYEQLFTDQYNDIIPGFAVGID